MTSRWIPRLFPTPPARRRQRNPFKSYDPAYVELLENRLLLAGQNVLAQTLTTMPGTNLDDISVRFDLTQGRASFAEAGIFVFDADGTVGGVAPGSAGFGQAVLNSQARQVLFAQGVSPGNTSTLTLVGGTQIGVYICQNEGTAPLENRFLVQTTSENTLRIGFDATQSLWPAVNLGPSTDARRFDDAVINVTLGSRFRFDPPFITPIADRAIPELAPFQFQVEANNPVGPHADLRYQIDAGPMGLSINAQTGILTWTPGESQGPGRFDVIVRVFNVNRPQSFSTELFTLDVTEVNSSPRIGTIPTQTVFQGQRVSFVVSATDSDLPLGPNSQLTFSLVDNTVAGATIDPSTGQFGWTPSVADAPGMYEFTVRVMDNGSPALSDTETFIVQVNPFP